MLARFVFDKFVKQVPFNPLTISVPQDIETSQLICVANRGENIGL